MGYTSRYEERTITNDYRASDRQTDEGHSFWRISGIVILVILLVLVIVGLPAFFQSNEALKPTQDDIKIAVIDASLIDEFNMTMSNSYSLDLNITLRNPNKYFRIYYGEALVVANYRHKSDMARIAEFHQPPKNTTFLTPSFKLERDNITDNAAGSGKENLYDIVVRLDLAIKKFKPVSWERIFGSGPCSAIFICDVKVPLQNGSRSATTAFNPTKCQSGDGNQC
ncbi:NDR1/HIN1-like protein 2 [Argentina anserina]|uniref:NDR1/HIN1-like protein 2 n=1 Tax=Argentina anserina TaxID=57926 RepID=UPI0021762AB9|nr:NDR1/HIN1-like protein 2 [Potentilla anserina]